MRLWTLHPRYLDAKGLVALWREGLLAKHVLEGKTKGYRHHPQLTRFLNHPRPIEAITNFLHGVVDEAEKRGYRFDRSKLTSYVEVSKITVTTGQVTYECTHLQAKLTVRDPQKLIFLSDEKQIEAHPLFTIVPGKIEVWEKQSSSQT